MSSKKRLNVDEKRSRLSEYFLNSRSVFPIKDIEKFAVKHCGIVLLTVKDVLQSLVDDNLVHCEKIGTSNYYWAFPSEADQIRRVQLEKLEMEQEKVSNSIRNCEKEIDRLSKVIVDTDERRELLQIYSELNEKSKMLREELARHADLDPETLRIRKREVELAKEAINRWTDNIYSIQSHCVNNFGVIRSEFDSQFNIPADLDYV